jgi:predicted Zn-dependent protease with MMP-like domain
LARIERLIDRGEGGTEALQLLHQLPPGPFVEPMLHLRAGDACFDLGELEAAERHYRMVLEREPASADALHRLGSIAHERGHQQVMTEAWLEVRRLDLMAPRPPWAVPEEDFVAWAEQAFGELPEVVKRKLVNLPLIVTDYPNAELVSEGVDPRSLGLITGVPLPDKGSSGQAELDCVQLYQRNIERIATTPQEVWEEVRITVLHETGHYFGLTDEDLEDLGLG